MKYKCIKEYPCGPKQGEIIKKYGDTENIYENERGHPVYVIDMEKYSEFFEKIVDKNYEVLSMPYAEITVVKRLSDHKTFMLGDKTNCGIIYKFIEIDNDIRVFFKDKPANYHMSLSSLRHSPVIFKSDDGVDIYEDDDYYLIPAKDSTSYIFVIAGKHSKSEPYFKRFSSEANCKEFLIKNTPCLSVKDVLNKTYLTYDEREALYNLVKSKINQ